MLLPAGGASMIVRFRRACGEERQQLKWFLYTICALIAFIASLILLETVVPRSVVPRSEWVVDLVFGVITWAFP